MDKKCIVCGKSMNILKNKGNYCNQCYYNKNLVKMKDKKCIGCGILISIRNYCERCNYFKNKYDLHDKCVYCGVGVRNGNLSCKSCSKKGNKNPQYGFKSHCWRGDNAHYNAIHVWVKKNKLMSFICEFCKQDKKLNLANISGKYNRDVDDFLWLCKRCHINYDFERIRDKNSEYYLNRVNFPKLGLGNLRDCQRQEALGGN
jgi:hypothetical protein